MIILDNGTIYDLNSEFLDSFQDQENAAALKKIIGINLLDIISRE